MHRLTYEDQKDLYEWLVARADNSHIMKLIGNYFEFGLGYLKIDYSEALKWYIRAANANNTNAMNIVASYYRKGKATDVNYVEALKWYQKAIIMYDHHAMNNMGLLYKTGLGVPQDNNEALKWFQEASEYGSIDALWNIAELFEKQSDIKNALTYYTHAYHNYKLSKNKLTCKKKIDQLLNTADTSALILQEWITLNDENKTLKTEIEELSTELTYQPPFGPGYQQAKNNFESLAKTLTLSPSHVPK